MICINVMNSVLRNVLASRRYRERDPERHKRIKSAWTAANRDRVNANGRKWAKNNPQQLKDIGLRRRYGVGAPEHLKLQLKKQNYTCAICHRSFESDSRESSLDHNHITGQWRGALCIKCNSLIGFCNEQLEILEATILYLKHWGGLWTGGRNL